MNQLTVLVSVLLVLLITNDVPAIIEAAGALKNPIDPLGVLRVKKIIDDAVTAVVETVTVPEDKVAVPTEPNELLGGRDTLPV